MVGWYLEVVVGYLIRIVIRAVRARGSSTWPLEKATVSDSRCPVAPYGGPVAEVGYTYTHEGRYFAGVHRMPLLRGSAEDYVARFPASSDVVIRVKPGEPEVSLVCDEDQSSGILDRKRGVGRPDTE
jgi:hypothetical protein